MTTATQIPGLTPNGDGSDGIIYYETVIKQMKWESHKNAGQYQFNDLAGCRENNPYWNAPSNFETLTKGKWYSLYLKTKPIPNAKVQGSLYQDIVKIEEVSGPAITSAEYDSYRPPDEDWHNDAPTDEDWDNMGGDPRAQEPQGNAEKPNKGIVVEGVVQGHLEKLAVDLYTQLRREGWDENLPINFPYIREIRDAFFHHVKEHSIMPLHYCYPHEQTRERTPAGTWVHPVDIDDQTVFCTADGLKDGLGNPVGGE